MDVIIKHENIRMYVYNKVLNMKMLNPLYGKQLWKSQEPCAKREWVNIDGFEDNEEMCPVIDSEQQELTLPHDSDEDNTEHAFPEFNVATDTEAIEFHIRMQFPNSTSFVKALMITSIKEC